MRSYYEHLFQTQKVQSSEVVMPTFRASAIFPAYHTSEISTRYIFLGYWLIKRNIKELVCIVTLRNQHGEVLFKKEFLIQEKRGYSIELSELLLSTHVDAPLFTGSVEIEFFSSEPLVYPFPAVTINIYGKKFSSVVHAAQRVYNDKQDMAANEKEHVAESGFNIIIDQNREPYLTLINGPQREENFKLDFQFINHREEILHINETIEHLSPYEARFIYPAQISNLELAKFLEKFPGTLKINFKLSWIYPRLIVGTYDKSLPAFSVTHSYYDCSCSVKPSDYWQDIDKEHYPASLLLPVSIEDDYFTRITFYPIYSPSNTVIDLEILDEIGHVQLIKKEILRFENSIGKYFVIDVNKICKDLSQKSRLSAHLIARSKKGSKIPARIKVSLDIGHKDKGMPCNICTNLVPFNPQLQDKSTTFRWLPILADKPGSSCWIMNNSPKIEQVESTHVELVFYREKDTKVLKRSLSILPKGFLEIREDKDNELSKFLNGTIGWCTVLASNPYISTYYFSDNSSGVIGGDHGY